MTLTPIKVRGKNRGPTTKSVSKLRGRGRPLKSQTNSSASNTDAEVESQHGGDANPRKRRKTRHARTLAPLERLPTEILQNIFFLSRNADLMFASKAVMHKLEKSEHVKIEFCFSTLFWPIINGEVDPDLNHRPCPSVSSADESGDDDDYEGRLLAQAQSRLLSCCFFTVQFFQNYLVKAYEMWNHLYASSHPERVVEMSKLGLTDRHSADVFLWEVGQSVVFVLPLLPTRFFATEQADEQVEAFREHLRPTAFHPSARIPIKFFRESTYSLELYSKEVTNGKDYIVGLDRYKVLVFLRLGLCLRMPVAGDSFDDLMRDVARTGNHYLIRAVLWFRVWEPTVDTPLPSDLLRVLVLEANCPKDIVEDILSPRAHEKARLSADDLLDPAVWAWAEKNGEDGEWLKKRLRARLEVP